MLLANMSVAQLIGLAFPDNALLRRHPTPQDRQLGELEASAQNLVTSSCHDVLYPCLALQIF